MARADFNRVAAVYDAGRSLPDEAMDAWRDAIAPFIPSSDRLTAIDLGCGTGRFSTAIAGWFKTKVVALDAALEMIRVANGQQHDGVAYLLGRAECLPLRDGELDFALLSTVFHHFDLPQVSWELRRVLKAEAPVLIRNWFPGREDVTHFHYFPRSKQFAETFPTIEEAVRVFDAHGFQQVALESVAQVSAPSLSVYRDRVATRADSTLLALSDEEFEEGMRALDRDVALEVDPEPVISHLDLLVLP
jgi:ubiquinone/menaquinone biosynthesis C-methylase UbiE